MSMLLPEILLSRKPRTRPPGYGANSFLNRVVLNSYTLLKRTKENVEWITLCRFQTVQMHANSKILVKTPVMQVLLDLVSWLINKSRSRRGSKVFCAEQGNTETESLQSLEKMTVVSVKSHWKGGEGWLWDSHLQWVGIKHREQGHPVFFLNLPFSLMIDPSHFDSSCLEEFRMISHPSWWLLLHLHPTALTAASAIAPSALCKSLVVWDLKHPRQWVSQWNYCCAGNTLSFSDWLFHSFSPNLLMYWERSELSLQLFHSVHLHALPPAVIHVHFSLHTACFYHSPGFITNSWDVGKGNSRAGCHAQSMGELWF